MNTLRILVVRLSSMGDVIHTLPAVAALKRTFPQADLTWLVRPRWRPLLDDNRYVDDVVPLERSAAASWFQAAQLRRQHFHVAIDFQGLMQSAAVAKAAGPARIFGFGKQSVRERPAAWLYSHTFEPDAAHVVDRNMELAAFVARNIDPAASSAAFSRRREFPLPDGKPEGLLPAGPFVLASPFAGWGAKQWPWENWAELAKLIDLPLVLNGPARAESELSSIAGVRVHLSGLGGLIDATRRATAVVGLDSGPLHLAAALSKPGVALYGPTDPARNGPYGNSLRVLRGPNAITDYRARGDYRRRDEPDRSMRALKPAMVAEALRPILAETRKEKA